MKFGCCSGLENAQILKEAGCDYMETNLGVIAGMSDEELKAKLDFVAACGIPVEATNCFFAGGVKLVGDDIDRAALKEYIERALERAAMFGVKVCVIGSGGARKIPEGYDWDKGYEQVLSAVRFAGETAEKYGITIAIEPLNHRESNVFVTVEESLEACRKIGLDNVTVLADIYHMVMQEESFDILPKAGKVLTHVHFSNPFVEGKKRGYPTENDSFDYAPFVSAIKENGYDGRISIEAAVDDIRIEGERGIAMMRELFK